MAEWLGTCAPVLRWNAAVNGGRQALVSEAMGGPSRPAADLVAALVAELGLPSRLSDVGVGRELFDEIAEKSLRDIFVHENPRPIRQASDVRGILEAAA